MFKDELELLNDILHTMVCCSTQDNEDDSVEENEASRLMLTRNAAIIRNVIEIVKSHARIEMITD